MINLILYFCLNDFYSVYHSLLFLKFLSIRLRFSIFDSKNRGNLTFLTEIDEEIDRILFQIKKFNRPKNEIDFERVMQFHPDSKPYKEWMETNEDELDKFVWKNW